MAETTSVTVAQVAEEVAVTITSAGADSVLVNVVDAVEPVSVVITSAGEEPVTVNVVDAVETVAVTVTESADAVVVNVVDAVEAVSIAVIESEGPAGPAGPAGESYDPTTSWFSLVTGATPTGPTAITGGVVYTYDYGTTTRYRFIATDGSIDAFYTTFDGSVVSGLVCTKALNF